MPRGNVDEMIRKEEDRKAQAEARLQRLKARKMQEARKRETKRKILIGAMVLDRIERGKVSEKLIWADMDQFLTRDHERALFDLPPRTAQSQPSGPDIRT